MDPLSLLREHNIANKPVLLQGEQLVFGSVRLSRDSPTAYRSLNGTGPFYAIDQLWFFLQNSKLSHAQYLMACNKNKIKAVSLPDKRDLLAYLTGQTDTSAAIDLANAPLVGEVDAAGVEQPAQKRARPADGAAELEDEQETQELIARARQIVEAALDGPALITVDAAADAPAAAAPAAEGEPAAAAAAGRARVKRRIAPLPTGGMLRALVAADMAETEQIVSRELRTATRSSVLLSPAGKEFQRVEQIVRGLREQARRHGGAPPPADRRAASAGGGPARASREAPSSRAGAPPGGAPPPGAPPQSRRPGGDQRPSSSSGGGGGTSRPLIIVVPAAITCTINMWNVKDFLAKGMYVPTAEKRKDPAAKKESLITHSHKLSTGQTLRFEIVDNVAKLSERDWKRVVAVFVQGSSWQFKGWPFRDTVAMLANVRGFYVRFREEVPPQMITSSDVKSLILSKEQSKRYLDSAVVKEFWATLEKFLVQHKRELIGLR